MAMQADFSVYPMALPIYASGAPTLSYVTCDAADETAVQIFRAPRSGEIDVVGFRTSGVTIGATIDVRLETVANGLNTGTLVDTNSNKTLAIADADDNKALSVTLTGAATVTKGQKLALVLKSPSADYGNVRYAAYSDIGIAGSYPPLISVGAVTAGCLVCWVHYADSPAYCYIPNVLPMGDAGINTNTFNNTSTPDIYGARFKLTGVGRRCRGCYVWLDLDGNCDVRLVTTAYHEANGTGILASAELTSDDDLATGAGLFYLEFDAATELAADTVYRLIVIPSSSTSLSTYDFTVPSAALLASAGGAEFYLTTAKTPTQNADWTDTNTRVPFMWLVFDGVDLAGGPHSVGYVG